MADMLKVLATPCPELHLCVGRATTALLRLFSPHTCLS